MAMTPAYNPIAHDGLNWVNTMRALPRLHRELVPEALLL